MTLSQQYETTVAGETQVKPQEQGAAQKSTVKEVKNCPTGDYCFENLSNYSKEVWIRGPEDGLGRTVLHKITVAAKEKGCFLNIPAKVYDITIITRIPAYNGVNFTEDYADKQIRVTPCAKETDITPERLR